MACAAQSTRRSTPQECLMDTVTLVVIVALAMLALIALVTVLTVAQTMRRGNDEDDDGGTHGGW
jgi:hypothetical protein